MLYFFPSFKHASIITIIMCVWSMEIIMNAMHVLRIQTDHPTSGLPNDAIRWGDEGKPSKCFTSPVLKPIVRCEPVG